MWRECKLGEVVNLKRGYDLPHDERVPGPFPIVSSSGITDHHAVAKVKGPGVVTGRYGTLGEVFFVEGDFWPLNTSLYVQDFKGSDRRFISYFLRQLNFGARNTAGAVAGVNRNHLHAIDVRVPPLQVQQRIAGILSAYDDLIENNLRRIRILETMARSLYREWFVNFQFPGHERVRRVTSVLGEIPDGWLSPLQEHVDFREGPGLRNWQYRDQGTPFLNIRTLVDNDIDFSNIRYLDPKEVDEKYQNFLLREYDHVVSSSGTIGRIVTIRGEHLPLMLNTSTIRMRPNSDRMSRWLLKHFMMSNYFQDQARSFAIGSVQPNFGPTHLKQMLIVAPDSRVAVEYERLVAPVELHVMALARQIGNLRRTRNLLLPRLLSG